MHEIKYARIKSKTIQERRKLYEYLRVYLVRYTKSGSYNLYTYTFCVN